MQPMYCKDLNHTRLNGENFPIYSIFLQNVDYLSDLRHSCVFDCMMGTFSFMDNNRFANEISFAMTNAMDFARVHI